MTQLLPEKNVKHTFISHMHVDENDRDDSFDGMEPHPNFPKHVPV